MAKVTITFEDKENGTFACIVDPDVKALLSVSAEDRTPAQAEAILLCAALLQQSKIADMNQEKGKGADIIGMATKRKKSVSIVRR